ncbi:MAG: hypothetical protein AAFX85_18825 [Pseudomonadota bacterium]
MATEKEKCFEEAWDKYKETFDDPMDVDVHRTWGLRNTGEWVNNYSSFWHAIRSYTIGNTSQVRVPDLTINNGGRTSVLDLKFDRPSGGRDTWSQRPGASGSMQQDDYVDINQQMNGDDDPHGDDPSLDSDKCGCNQPGGTAVEPIVYRVWSQLGQFSVAPGPLAPGVRLPPIRIPVPVLPPGLGGGLGPRGLPGIRVP